MPHPIKLADRMKEFEANIRENETLGFDSTPIALAGSAGRRHSAFAARVSPKLPVGASGDARRRHTVAGVSKKKVLLHGLGSLPRELPLPLGDDAKGTSDESMQLATALNVLERNSQRNEATGNSNNNNNLLSSSGHARVQRNWSKVLDSVIPEQAVVEVEQLVAKCQFHYLKPESKPTAPIATELSVRRKALPAYMFSSGISSAAASAWQIHSEEHLPIQDPPVSKAVATEVTTYRGMLRLQQQQTKQARRATYSGGSAIHVPNDIRGLNEINNQMSPIPACSNTTSRTTAKSMTSVSSSNHDSDSSDSEDSDDDMAAGDTTTTSRFESFSRSVNDLEHVEFSDIFKRAMGVNNDMEPMTCSATTTTTTTTTPTTVVASITSAIAPAKKETATKSNDNIMAASDHTADTAFTYTSNASETNFDFGASMSSVDNFDCGGAYFEEHRLGTELHPSYEQQRRISMARERARAKKEQQQMQKEGQVINTGASIKDRMAAFLKAT